MKDLTPVMMAIMMLGMAGTVLCALIELGTSEQFKEWYRNKKVKNGTASRQDLEHYIYWTLVTAEFSRQFSNMRDAYDDLISSDVLKVSPFCEYLKQTINKAYDTVLNASLPTIQVIHNTPNEDSAQVVAKTLMPSLDDMYNDLTAHFEGLHAKLKEQRESALNEYAKQLTPLTDDVSNIIEQCMNSAERVCS